MKYLQKFSIFEKSRVDKTIEDLEKLSKETKGKEKKLIDSCIKNLIKMDKKNKKDGTITMGDLLDKIDEIRGANFVEEEGKPKRKLTQKDKDREITKIEDIISDMVSKMSGTYHRTVKKK